MVYDHSSMGISNHVWCMSLTNIDEHMSRNPIDLSEQKILMSGAPTPCTTQVDFNLFQSFVPWIGIAE